MTEILRYAQNDRLPVKSAVTAQRRVYPPGPVAARGLVNGRGPRRQAWEG